MPTWLVKNEDCNNKKIKDYDILKYETNLIKKLKKKCVTKEEFSEELKHEMRYQYWSRCEYELIISKTEDGRILLLPWIGKADFNLDVTEDKGFDWAGFFDYHVSKQIFKDRAKIDIYDQLMWRWDEFVDYCWDTRFPYERKNVKFEGG